VSRLGLYGGSFDPIHRGHVEPVLEAARQLELDRVIYLPTAHPPHKPGERFAPPARRLAMVELAIAEHPLLAVSDYELGDEPSYTIDTLEHFARAEPDATLYLLIGSDSLAAIAAWRRWRDLFAAARVAVLDRPGWPRDRVLARLPPEVAVRVANAEIAWIDHRPIDVSATEIRRRLRAGEPVPDDWVPAAVLEYAVRHRLYS
jgi:nicotinate-nucleotide adenylyltransferase